MPRTPVDNLIPKADKLLIQAFPKVAKRLESEVDNLDKGEMDAYLKLLPGAVERFQAVTAPTNDLHESVEVAIFQLVAGFPKQSFGPQSASAVESASQFETSNTSVEADETAESVSGSDQPNGSDTDQSVGSNSLPHNVIEAATGDGGKPGSEQGRPRNARVRTASRLQGRRSAKRAQRATGESADDHGRLSGPEGRNS